MLLCELVDDTADLSADTVSSYFSLNAVNDLVYLIVREVDADNAFNSLDRVLLEFAAKSLSFLTLFTSSSIFALISIPEYLLSLKVYIYIIALDSGKCKFFAL